MDVDLWKLYRMMLKLRRVEERIKGFWEDGLISGEMHLGTGEEAVIVGVVDHLLEGDALALDHRSTPPLIARGIDPVLIFKELLGKSDGLCGGGYGDGGRWDIRRGYRSENVVALGYRNHVLGSREEPSPSGRGRRLSALRTLRGVGCHSS